MATYPKDLTKSKQKYDHRGRKRKGKVKWTITMIVSMFVQNITDQHPVLAS